MSGQVVVPVSFHNDVDTNVDASLGSSGGTRAGSGCNDQTGMVPAKEVHRGCIDMIHRSCIGSPAEYRGE